jgi:hypothetical protein
MYEELNGTLAGENVIYFFSYANSVTGNLFVIFMVLAFFSIVLIGSLIMQKRFTGRMRFETGLLASSFSTLGFAVILSQVTDLGPIWAPFFIVLVVLTVLSFLWMAMSND